MLESLAVTVKSRIAGMIRLAWSWSARRTWAHASRRRQPKDDSFSTRKKWRPTELVLHQKNAKRLNKAIKKWIIIVTLSTVHQRQRKRLCGLLLFGFSSGRELNFPNFRMIPISGSALAKLSSVYRFWEGGSISEQRSGQSLVEKLDERFIGTVGIFGVRPMDRSLPHVQQYRISGSVSTWFKNQDLLFTRLLLYLITVHHFIINR